VIDNDVSSHASYAPQNYLYGTVRTRTMKSAGNSVVQVVRTAPPEYFNFFKKLSSNVVAKKRRIQNRSLLILEQHQGQSGERYDTSASHEMMRGTRIHCTSVLPQRWAVALLLVLFCALRDGKIEAWSQSLLFKTKETFKLAEIQNLEASLQTACSETFHDGSSYDNNDNDIKNNNNENLVLRYNLTRLVVDRATGSSLFRLDLQSKTNDDTAFTTVQHNGAEVFPGSEKLLLSKLLSLSSLQRCDWVGQVIEEGSDAPELVENLRIRQNWSLKKSSAEIDVDGWNLDYVRFVGEVTSRTRTGTGTRTKPTYTMKSLLCAVAHEIPARPVLDPSRTKTRLLIVDTTTGGPGSSSFLVRCLDHRPRIVEKSPLQLEWAQRPFQYSSAINYEVAEMVMELLITLCDERQQNSQTRAGGENATRVLLDPTCGSGTFLALAMDKGFRVEGCDINPSVAEGAIRNLERVFGKSKAEALAHVETRDSCDPWRNSESSSGANNNAVVSCVVANLPWGRNSILYVDENKRILRSVRSQIIAGTPCAFITRPSDSGEDKAPSLLFESTGFDVLGQAFVPQRDFLLPISKKTRKKNPGAQNSDTDRDKQNQCVITIAKAK